MKSRLKIRICPCSKEVPLGRSPSPYCSEACRDIYGSRRPWAHDYDPESKAIEILRNGSEWAKSLTREQLVHWYRIKCEPEVHCMTGLHGEKFFIAFDDEFKIPHIKIKNKGTDQANR